MSNFKVRFTKLDENDKDFILNKIYNVKDGKIVAEDGFEYKNWSKESDSDTINNSEWVEFYDPEDKDKSRFEKYIQEENPDYEFDSYDTLLGIPNPFDLFDNYHKMVKGSVFVPITDNLLATGTGTKKNYKESTQYELETQRQIQEFKRKYSLNQTENINDKLDGK